MAEKVKKKMATDIKVFIVVCIVIALILTAAIVYLFMPKDIAIVNNNKVTESEMSYYFSQNVQMLSYYTGGQITEEVISYAKQQALNQAVEIEYLLQEADKNGFTVSKEEIDAAWNEMDTNIKSSAEAYGISVNELCEQLLGVKYNQAKSIYKDSIIAQFYKEKAIEDILVDDAELKAFYEDNKDSFDYNKVSHILITVDEEAEDSVVEEKKKMAEELLDRVNKGEDFAALAMEYSEDPGFAQSGGQYDVKKGQMVAEFEDWTFSNDVGDTGIVKTDYGFHIMRLDSINDTFEALKDSVAFSFKSDKYQTTLQEALSEGEYLVEIKDSYYEFTGA